ncbi:TfoX/Sxy family protein [Candidatus Gottesmanbacteria bacterium]|nr:TfoX/Sxy family protein [Candidatus Gottesmanbacteria bacterium]
MPKDESFKEYVVTEVLGGVDGITARAMFGGYGIYRHDIFFALIADGVLYFKINDTNRKDFQNYGSKQFIYISPKGKKMMMDYYELPSEVMEDTDLVKDWVEKSYQIALKVKKR